MRDYSIRDRAFGKDMPMKPARCDTTKDVPSDCGDLKDCSECINADDCRPRWAEGSLAEQIAHETRRHDFADSVEALMREARTFHEFVTREGFVCRDNTEMDFLTALETVERWKS